MTTAFRLFLRLSASGAGRDPANVKPLKGENGSHRQWQKVGLCEEKGLILAVTLTVIICISSRPIVNVGSPT
jgi:hypothetical protein